MADDTQEMLAEYRQSYPDEYAYISRLVHARLMPGVNKSAIQLDPSWSTEKTSRVVCCLRHHNGNVASLASDRATH